MWSENGIVPGGDTVLRRVHESGRGYFKKEFVRQGK